MLLNHKKITSSLIKVAAIAGCINSVLFQVPIVSAETFLGPKIEGKYIDSCLLSYRFQDSCGKAARQEVAQQFCLIKGYSSWQKWQTYDYGWDNRTRNWKWHETYVDGKLQSRFRSNEGANRFNVIECR